jgi:hypothetical protein
MKKQITLIFLLYLSNAMSAQTPPTPCNERVIALSQALLYAVKTQTPSDSLETTLAQLPLHDLTDGLCDDRAKKTFWINLYNAYYQLFALRNQKRAPAIFKDRDIRIAGQLFSLDDLEHGILRRYRWKYSLGYLPQFFPAKRIKQLAVQQIDYRIHFALNCGAKSCPPIAFYEYSTLEQQLNAATQLFLSDETQVDSVQKTLYTSRLLQWFAADFGSKKQVRALLSDVLKQDVRDYRIRYKKYDWAAQMQYYRSE